MEPEHESRPRIRHQIFEFLVWICSICFASIAFAQTRYQITRIPTPQGSNSVALGINNKGEVVGYSFQGEDYQAFLYSFSDQSLTGVGSFGGKINAACAINDAGQVTGYSQDENGNLLGFIFSRSQPIGSLGTLEGSSTSEAFGINSKGTAVGDSQSGTRNHRPVLFSNGSVQDLGLGGSNDPDALETAYAINETGQIVGRHSAGNNAFHAFVFVNGNTTDLSTLGGANGEALAVNKKGQVVGDSDTTEGPAHAFIFDHSQLKDLGTLPGFDNASYSRGINISGDIVGESDSADQKRAFLYARGQLAELDKLAENLPEVGFTSLDVAYGINDKGWIVGYGTTSDNQTAAFVAVPEGRGEQGQAASVAPPQGQRNVPQSNETDYDVFYTRLSSDEGSWVEAGDYGYCFRPRVSEDWRPYRDGHWVWTDRGWYWDSNERFAWATYHYGRWVDIGGTGWCWVPGNQWAPAWVSWRQSDQDVGWAPLPPEADVSGNLPISSWSDSYYGIGPAAYAFISYSHWHEPSYARYFEPPERNIQIISGTKNVTNIVTNNNVINNFGPTVQTVATKTNRDIQPVKLALSPATDPNANYGQALQGNQLKVVAPPVTLQPQARRAPAVQNRIANPQFEKGWQGVKPQDAEKLKKTIAEQNPPPNDLPKQTAFVKPQIGNQGQVIQSPGATGSPTSKAGQKTPSNLVTAGARSPNANVAPGGSPNAAAQGRRVVPPNLLGAKPSGTPGVSRIEKRSGAGSPNANVTPGGSPNAAAPEKESGPPNLLGEKPSGRPGASPTAKPSGTPAPKVAPPNLNAPRPSTTPAQAEEPQGNHPAGGPAPKPTGKLPPGQNTPGASATPHNAVTPTAEKKQITAPTPTPQGGPANPTAPKPTDEVKPIRRDISTPGPATVSTPPRKPVAAPKPPAEEEAAPAPKEESKAPPPEIAHPPAPQPQARQAPPAQPPAPKGAPSKEEIKTPTPEVAHPPAPQPQARQAPPAQPPAPKAAPSKEETKTPPPEVAHPPAPQPQARQAPAQPQAQKTAPPQESRPPKGEQKHEPEKGKPTPTP
jgi:probable HAF family extracellular repeat protein